MIEYRINYYIKEIVYLAAPDSYGNIIKEVNRNINFPLLLAMSLAYVLRLKNKSGPEEEPLLNYL